MKEYSIDKVLVELTSNAAIQGVVLFMDAKYLVFLGDLEYVCSNIYRINYGALSVRI